MNSALVMAHSPGIWAVVIIPPGIYLWLRAAELPSGAGSVFAPSKMLLLTPLALLLLQGWGVALYSSQTRWAEAVKGRCVYASACRQALNDALPGLILIHHFLWWVRISLAPLCSQNVCGIFWRFLVWDFFWSNMSLMQMGLYTEDDLVKRSLVPYLCESINV